MIYIRKIKSSITSYYNSRRSYNLLLSRISYALKWCSHGFKIMHGYTRYIICSMFNIPYDRPYFVLSKKYKSAYLLNCKVACSSITKSILDVEIGASLNYEKYGDIHIAAQNNKLCKTIRQIDDSYMPFTVVRNPYTRIISCYKNKFTSIENLMYSGFEFDGYLGGVLHRNMSFEEFVRIICQIPDHLCDRHFRTQYYGINLMQIPSSNIHKLEDVNLNTTLSRYGISLDKKENASNSYSNLENYFSSDLYKIFNRKYLRDFEEFNYVVFESNASTDGK